jgi:hypothetical protein
MCDHFRFLIDRTMNNCIVSIPRNVYQDNCCSAGQSCDEIVRAPTLLPKLFCSVYKRFVPRMDWKKRVYKSARQFLRWRGSADPRSELRLDCFRLF